MGPLYLWAVIVAGGTVFAYTLYELVKDPIPHEWMLLAALTLLSFFLANKVLGIPATISVSETFVFATVLLFGTHAATVTVALDGLIMSGWRHRREPVQILFTATEPALSVWIASQLFFSIESVSRLVASLLANGISDVSDTSIAAKEKLRAVN